jgi:hypothetical protein
MQQVEISLNKKKMFWALMSGTVFVLVGVWFLFFAPKSTHSTFGNPKVIFAIGLTAVLFCVFLMIAVMEKITDKKPGFIINEEGIIDNSMGFSIGLVEWTDVHYIQKIDQVHLMFAVKNPQTYIDRETSIVNKKNMQMNINLHGSPIVISSRLLDIDSNELYELVLKQFYEKLGIKF